MTTLEIILIAYICISQMLTMVILSSSAKKNKQIKIALFAVLNPLGIMVAYIIERVQEKKGE